jgi:hypothetical protein
VRGRLVAALPPLLVCRWVLEKEGRKADAVTEVEAATKRDAKFEPAQKDLKRLHS